MSQTGACVLASCLIAGNAVAGLVEGPKWSFVCGGETFEEGARLPERLGLRVDATASCDPELPIEEWTFSLTGVGTNDTPRLSRLLAADFTLPFAADDEVVLWHGIGETDPNATAKDNYSFRRTPLAAGAAPLRFQSCQGYPCYHAFPYFRVYSAKTGRGATIALGYQGEWSASFARTATGVRMRGGQKEVDFHLKPGEKVIAPTVTVMAFTDADDAVNGWRRFLRKRILPRDRRTGGPLRPILGVDAHESGELYTESTGTGMVARVREMRAAGLDFDMFWIDAGWYTPKGWVQKGRVGKWYESTGDWTPDPARFPDGLKPLADELAKGDAVLTLWYDPERVHGLSRYVKTAWPHLVQKEIGGVYRYNLSRPEVVDHLIELIGGSLAANGVKLYRQDSNGPGPLYYWQAADAARGDGRKGLAENFAVQGQTRFWEGLRTRVPDLLFDTCASGGRRNDLSTLRFPSVPLHYTDVGWSEFTEKQRYVHMLNQWFIYRKTTGSSAHRDGRIDWRSVVVDWAPCHVVRTWCFLRPDNADEKRIVAMWRRTAPLMIDGDYYLLTPEVFGVDRWWCCQFHDPATGRGFLQVVRNPKNAEPMYAVHLKGVKAGTRVRCEDLLSGRSFTYDPTRPLELTLPPNAGTLVAYEVVDDSN